MLLKSRVLERIDLPNLRYITSTGDVFPPSHIQRLKDLLPQTNIYPMYGLTECKRVSIVPGGKLRGREFSVGLPLPGTQVSIVDITGSKVLPGTIGELIVRGPHVMAGYWNDPVETARRFRRNNETEDVLLFTGDFFWMDEDGFLYFTGRDGSFIKSHGQKVSPPEIESFLATIDGISEAAVVGVPDPVVGEFVYAFVYLIEPGYLCSQDIKNKCKNSLAPIERPKYIEISNTPLPKTLNGKINRLRLQQLAQRTLARK